MYKKNKHFVSISGGKDSTACLILAAQRGRPFEAVFADTGHESPVTLKYIANLESHFNIKIRRVSACFKDRIKKKRETVRTKWKKEGIPQEIRTAALAALKPTGNPFLDLAIWKGRFPSVRAQFCTEHLKATPIYEQITKPALKNNSIVMWTGERREESRRRSDLPRYAKIALHDSARTFLRFRPLVNYTAAQVFDLHAAAGVEPNPLYKQGFTRVGCFPCIHARKTELRQIFLRYPEAVKRLEQWEKIAGAASKRQQTTFFAAGTSPLSKRTGRIEGAREVFDWALTSRGGVQKDAFLLDGPACASEYGLCE